MKKRHVRYILFVLQAQPLLLYVLFVQEILTVFQNFATLYLQLKVVKVDILKAQPQMNLDIMKNEAQMNLDILQAQQVDILQGWLTLDVLLTMDVLLVQLALNALLQIQEMMQVWEMEAALWNFASQYVQLMVDILKVQQSEYILQALETRYALLERLIPHVLSVLLVLDAQ